MARKTNLDGLIHCDSCGEDYSATYKRCPFCGGRQSGTAPVRQDPDDEDDGYVFDGQDAFDDIPEVTSSSRSKGGKRLASGSGRRSGSSSTGRGAPPPPINWPRLITFLCSLVIIVAALIIVFTVIYPQLHKDPTPNASIAPTGEPSSLPSALPSQDPADPSADPAVSDDPSSSAPTSVTSLTLDTYDFTLWPGQSHTLKVTVAPADWDGEVTFTSSDTNYATVDANGTVTHVNTSTSLRRVIITVTAGGQSAECTVYCRGTETSTSAPPVVTTPAPGTSQAPSGGLAAGAQGTIINAAGGLRVRSGPGTSYSVLASLVNGSKVTIVSNAGDGWYEITFAGSGGTATTGYIMGEYISVP